MNKEGIEVEAPRIDYFSNKYERKHVKVVLFFFKQMRRSRFAQLS